MAGSSQKKIDKARSEASQLYLPIFVIVEALQLIFYFVIPFFRGTGIWALGSTITTLVSEGEEDEEGELVTTYSAWPLRNRIIISLLITLALKLSYNSILISKEQSVSGGQASSKWSSKGSSAGQPPMESESKKQQKAASLNVDIFALFSVLKLLTIVTDRTFTFNLLVVVGFYVYRLWEFVSIGRNVYSSMTGGKKEAAAPMQEAVEDPYANMDRKERRKEMRKAGKEN
jgi:hypothetical protein